MNRSVAIISFLLSIVFTTSADEYGKNYFSARKKSAVAGLVMRGVGVGVQYGIGVPMTLNAEEESDQLPGIIVANVGSGIALAGDITAGAAASKAYASAKKFGYSGPKMNWGFFGAGIGCSILGTVIGTVAESENATDHEGLIIGSAIAAQLFFTLHTVRSVIITEKVKNEYAEYEDLRIFSLSINPVVSQHGAGARLTISF